MVNWNLLVVVCAGLVTVLTLFDKISGYVKKAKDPVTVIKTEMLNITTKLDNDNRRIQRLEKFLESQEESNKIIMRTLLALVGHEIEGNHTGAMKSVETELTTYLVNR